MCTAPWLKSAKSWASRLLRSPLSRARFGGMPPLNRNEFKSLLTVTVCPDAGRVPIVWRSAWVRAASASRGQTVAASTQAKTSTASISVATAPMPVRRLMFTRPAFMVMPPPPRAVLPRVPAPDHDQGSGERGDDGDGRRERQRLGGHTA